MSRRPTPFQSPCCAPDLDRTCQGCGRVFCQIHDATVGDDGYCPDCADPLAPLDHWRAQRDWKGGAA
jgi:hypothetical protein